MLESNVITLNSKVELDIPFLPFHQLIQNYFSLIYFFIKYFVIKLVIFKSNMITINYKIKLKLLSSV